MRLSSHMSMRIQVARSGTSMLEQGFSVASENASSLNSGEA